MNTCNVKINTKKTGTVGEIIGRAPNHRFQGNKGIEALENINTGLEMKRRSLLSLLPNIEEYKRLRVMKMEIDCGRYKIQCKRLRAGC